MQKVRASVVFSCQKMKNDNIQRLLRLAGLVRVTLHHTDAITVVLFNAAGYSCLTTMAGYVPIKQSSYM